MAGRDKEKRCREKSAVAVADEEAAEGAKEIEEAAAMGEAEAGSVEPIAMPGTATTGATTA